jgi:hypothetical protein
MKPTDKDSDRFLLEKPMPPPNEVCQLHTKIEGDFYQINKKLDQILSRLGDGDVSIAQLKLRVDQLERFVYGAMALAMTSIVGAILSLVIKVSK